MAYYHKFPSLFRPQGGMPPFSPTDIANLALWLDAADSATITQVAGSVSQWNDKSGKGYNATQGTGTSQPVTGLRSINGKNAIKFDGTDDFVNINTGLRSMLTGTNQTAFSVCATDSTAGVQAHFVLNNGGSPALKHSFENTGFSASTQGAGGLLLTVSRDTNPHIVGNLLNIPNRTTFYDGLTATDTNGVSPTYNNAVLMGRESSGANPFNGITGEHIVYAAALTTTQINQVGNYLAAKWGITWTNL